MITFDSFTMIIAPTQTKQIIPIKQSLLNIFCESQTIENTKLFIVNIKTTSDIANLESNLFRLFESQNYNKPTKIVAD